MHRQPRFSIWAYFAGCYGMSSVSTVCRKISRGQPVELRLVIGAALWSSLASAAIGALLAPRVLGNLSLLLVVSLLAGIGTAGLAEACFRDVNCIMAFVAVMFRRRPIVAIPDEADAAAKS